MDMLCNLDRTELSKSDRSHRLVRMQQHAHLFHTFNTLKIDNMSPLHSANSIQRYIRSIGHYYPYYLLCVTCTSPDIVPLVVGAIVLLDAAVLL